MIDMVHKVLHIYEKSNTPSLSTLDWMAYGIDYHPVSIDTDTSFRTAVEHFDPQLVLTDYVFSGLTGISAIQNLKTTHPDMVIIVLTASISEYDAIECIKAGVSNIVNFDQIPSIVMIVHEALKSRQARIEKQVIEEQLAREREILTISLANVGEGIITIDDQDRIVLINQAAQRITGFSESESKGQPSSVILRLLDKKTNLLIEKPVEYLLDLERISVSRPISTKPVLLTKNGDKIILGGKITPIFVQNGIPAGFVIIFDDITQKEQLAAQSMLSSKMESIGQLAAGIAHEINTPIQYIGDNISFIQRSFEIFRDYEQHQVDFLQLATKINGCSEQATTLLLERDALKTDHLLTEIPRAIQESQEGIGRVRKIIQAIREFSHPSNKDMQFADINRNIQTTVTISRNEWKYSADLETDLAEDLPLVKCRIDGLNQVLLNMIVNSTHAIQEKQKQQSQEKGKITIRTECREDKVFISISDTGCGIPQNIVNRIFDPFFTTKEVGKGTGQGLSLAHSIIVNQHHGMIHVETMENIGSTFTIEIPIDPSTLEENRESN